MRKANPARMSATMRKKYEGKQRRDYIASRLGTSPKHPPREPKRFGPVYRVGREWFHTTGWDGEGVEGPFESAREAHDSYHVFGRAEK